MFKRGFKLPWPVRRVPTEESTAQMLKRYRDEQSRTVSEMTPPQLQQYAAEQEKIRHDGNTTTHERWLVSPDRAALQERAKQVREELKEKGRQEGVDETVKAARKAEELRGRIRQELLEEQQRIQQGNESAYKRGLEDGRTTHEVHGNGYGRPLGRNGRV